MGADLLIAICRWPRVIRDGDTVISSQLRPEERVCLWSRIQALGHDALREIAACWGEEGSEANARALLIRAVDDVIANPWRRDIELAELCGDFWVLTGGMSSGDVPTDAYPLVSALALSGITEEPICPDPHPRA
jgi:hypothetical protein